MSIVSQKVDARNEIGWTGFVRAANKWLVNSATGWILAPIWAIPEAFTTDVNDVQGQFPVVYNTDRMPYAAVSNTQYYYDNTVAGWTITTTATPISIGKGVVSEEGGYILLDISTWSWWGGWWVNYTTAVTAPVSPNIWDYRENTSVIPSVINYWNGSAWIANELHLERLTKVQLDARIAASTLVIWRSYTITDYNNSWSLWLTEITSVATSNNTLDNNVEIRRASWWAMPLRRGLYDYSLNKLIYVNDNSGNEIYGDTNISWFIWNSPTVINNRIYSDATVTFVWFWHVFRDNIIATSTITVNSSSNFSSNHIYDSTISWAWRATIRYNKIRNFSLTIPISAVWLTIDSNIFKSWSMNIISHSWATINNNNFDSLIMTINKTTGSIQINNNNGTYQTITLANWGIVTMVWNTWYITWFWSSVNVSHSSNFRFDQNIFNASTLQILCNSWWADYRVFENIFNNTSQNWHQTRLWSIWPTATELTCTAAWWICSVRANILCWAVCNHWANINIWNHQIEKNHITDSRAEMNVSNGTCIIWSNEIRYRSSIIVAANASYLSVEWSTVISYSYIDVNGTINYTPLTIFTWNTVSWRSYLIINIVWWATWLTCNNNTFLSWFWMTINNLDNTSFSYWYWFTTHSTAWVNFSRYKWFWLNTMI